MKSKPTIPEMVQYAKAQGLKRLKVGSLEIELSDYELTLIYSEKLKNAENLTSANNATNTPSLSQDANQPIAQIADDDNEDELLYHSTI